MIRQDLRQHTHVVDVETGYVYYITMISTGQFFGYQVWLTPAHEHWTQDFSVLIKDSFIGEAHLDKVVPIRHVRAVEPMHKKLAKHLNEYVIPLRYEIGSEVVDFIKHKKGKVIWAKVEGDEYHYGIEAEDGDLYYAHPRDLKRYYPEVKAELLEHWLDIKPRWYVRSWRLIKREARAFLDFLLYLSRP